MIRVLMIIALSIAAATLSGCCLTGGCGDCSDCTFGASAK